MAMEQFDPEDPDQMARMQEFFGPQQVDQQIRQAISFCWMALPSTKRNADQVESEIRRLVDRALNDFREDSTRFGSSSS